MTTVSAPTDQNGHVHTVSLDEARRLVADHAVQRGAPRDGHLVSPYANDRYRAACGEVARAFVCASAIGAFLLPYSPHDGSRLAADHPLTWDADREHYRRVAAPVIALFKHDPHMANTAVVPDLLEIVRPLCAHVDRVTCSLVPAAAAAETTDPAQCTAEFCSNHIKVAVPARIGMFLFAWTRFPSFRAMIIQSVRATPYATLEADVPFIDICAAQFSLNINSNPTSAVHRGEDAALWQSIRLQSPFIEAVYSALAHVDAIHPLGLRAVVRRDVPRHALVHDVQAPQPTRPQSARWQAFLHAHDVQ